MCQTDVPGTGRRHAELRLHRPQRVAGPPGRGRRPGQPRPLRAPRRTGVAPAGLGPARPARGDADLAGSRLLNTEPEDPASEDPTTETPPRPPVRWGMGEAAAGLVIANVAGAVVGAVIIAATGNLDEAA